MPVLYWSHTLLDIRTMVRLKIGHEQTFALQQYNSLAMVVSMALGGKPKGAQRVDPSKPLDQQFDQLYQPRNEAELQMALNKVLGRS